MKLFFCRSASVLALSSLIVACAGPNLSVSGPGFYEFHKLAEGVYAGIPKEGTPQQNGAVNCNVMVVVGDKDVLLVDGATEPDSAKRLLAAVKTLTDKPVRYVVNTHFHFDHAGANGSFGREVHIIGSEYTAQRLSVGPYEGRSFQRFGGAGDKGVLGLQQQSVSTLKANLAKETDPAKIAPIQAQIAAIEGQIAATKMSVTRVPDIIVKDKLVIPRSAGEIQILHVGRGHTGGDVIVYLPREGIVATGDLVHERLSAMGDAYLDEWPEAIEKVKQLKIEQVFGGHGKVLPGTAKMTAYQGYLRDFAAQAATLKRQGVSPEDAPKRMNLSAYAGVYPQAANPPSLVGVARYYELLDGKDLP
jgi:cyclase